MISVGVRILDDAGALVLDCTEAAGYVLVSISEGSRSWRRYVAQGRFVAGDALVAATLASGTEIIQWLVVASTSSALRTRIANLRAALEQFAWRLEVSIEGTVEVLACDVSDTTIGDAGVWAPFYLADHKQLLTATIPRQPDPISVVIP
jgi:hypothetical protein